MRQDIYVVQKTAEEGKELEEWCIENHIPISSSRFGFDESWKLFIWYQTLQNGFIANQNIKINKQDLTQVTIEEFKRLQLESLGKTEELKIGDWVLIKLDQFDSLGEGGKFNDKKGVPLRIEEISNRCICKLSGIHCILSFDRFEKCEKPSSDLKSEFIVGKWYKILDNWWAKFKTVHNSGNRWQFSEHIDKNGAYSNIIQSIDVISEIKLLTDLSEIQEYLPLNHSDLIVKNICPEYVEYIDTKYKGQIVRVTKWSANSYCEVIFSDGTKEQPFKHLVKAVTKEQWEQQQYGGTTIHPHFQKDQCIVLLREEGRLTKLNYVVKQRHDSESLIPICDCLGKEDRSYDWGSSYNIKTKNWRYATQAETDEYNRLGKPFDVTTLNKPKYEVVHCKTQEEWDFVIKTEKITKLNSKTFKQNEKECIVLKALKYQSDIHTASSHKWLSENNAKIYTFEEWCNNNGYSFEPVKQKSINFGGLNLENWLRETKKLNLSLEELDKHISSGATCHFDNVYSWLNGIGSLEKAEILWNEWNKPGIDKKDFIVSIPDEWGQNKYVIGIDLYKLPETQLLIKHKNSQINTEVKNESSVKTNLKQKSKKVLF